MKRVLSLRTERLEVCGGLFSSQNSVQKTEMTIAMPTKRYQLYSSGGVLLCVMM